MTFVGINYWAVLVASTVGFLFGGVWHRLLAEPWKAAHGFTTEQIRAHHGRARRRGRSSSRSSPT